MKNIILIILVFYFLFFMSCLKINNLNSSNDNYELSSVSETHIISDKFSSSNQHQIIKFYKLQQERERSLIKELNNLFENKNIVEVIKSDVIDSNFINTIFFKNLTQNPRLLSLTIHIESEDYDTNKSIYYGHRFGTYKFNYDKQIFPTMFDNDSLSNGPFINIGNFTLLDESKKLRAYTVNRINFLNENYDYRLTYELIYIEDTQ